MEIRLKKVGNDIVKFTDFTDAKERGEIAHFIAELEVMKRDLVELWDADRDAEFEFEKDGED